MSEDLITLQTDGACRGNPGPASIGAVAYRDGQELLTISKAIGVTTNNVAEYTALKEGLRKLQSEGFKNIEVKADSELMIKQLNGIYKVKNPNLKPIFLEIKELEKDFDRVNYLHVRREFNKRADELANLAL